MKILLLHLSDTHFVGDRSRSPHADKIAACVVERNLLDLPVIVAITGDIVHKGCQQGYDEALSFLRDLERTLQSKCGCDIIGFAVVPGNHDCNDKYSSNRRNSLINELLLKKREFDETAWRECLTVQKDFLAFRASLQAQEQPELPGFCVTTIYPMNGKSLAVSCFNTAFMERTNDPMVQPVLPLYDPTPLQKAVDADLSIALMHHAPSWFKDESAIKFSELLQLNYDIVLLGHGHRSKTTTELNAEAGWKTTFLQGGVFSHPSDQTRMFKLLACNVEEGSKKIIVSEHNQSPGSTHYTCTAEREVVVDNLDSTTFVVNKKFEKELDDIGWSIRHPTREVIQLSDVYVYPSLRVISTGAKPTETSFDLRTGEEIIKLVLQRKHIRVCGSHRSGKTALLRMLYKELLTRGFTPVLICGDHLRETSPDSLQELGREMFAKQYSEQTQDVTAYLQLERARKVLLVDDLDCSPVVKKPRLRSKLMAAMHKQFGVVIACESEASIADPTQIAMIAQSTDTYTYCELLRFSPRLRGRLIDKWATLGHRNQEDEADFFHRVDELERHVNELLGSKSYPECPFAVLAVLHFRDSGTPISIGEGSLSSLYRMLIEEELMKSGPRPSVDELRTFLAMIAYHMFKESKEIITMNETQTLSDEYRKQTDVTLELEKAMRKLTSTHIMSETGDGYRFEYSLEHLSSLQFLTLLLGEDDLLIQQLLLAARKLLGDSPSADLDKDTEFLNRLVYKAPRFVLPARRDAKFAREEKRRILERLEEEATAREEEKNQVSATIMSAFNAMRLLGWLVRNNPTTLGATVKRQVVEELYRVGLRLLTDYYTETDSLLANFGDDLEGLLDESLNEGARAEILDQFKVSLFNLGALITSILQWSLQPFLMQLVLRSLP
jgi:predicted MPP superfamily phosphohydrolase